MGTWKATPTFNGQILRAVGLRDTLEKACQEIRWGQKDPHLEESSLATFADKSAGEKEWPRCSGDGHSHQLCCFIKVGPGRECQRHLQRTRDRGWTEDRDGPDGCRIPSGFPSETVLHLEHRHDITPYNGSVGSSVILSYGNAIASPATRLRRKIHRTLQERLLENRPARLDLSEGKIFDDAGKERSR